MNNRDLPRLLYISDVPVEATTAGMVQIYRLLETYPKDRLLICQSNVYPLHRDVRLPGVRYEEFNLGNPRWRTTRFASLHSLYLWFRSRLVLKEIEERVKHFRPEAILTIAHGVFWTTAASYARKHRLSLNLSVNDDPMGSSVFGSLVRKLLRRQFERAYKNASSKFLVSPAMVDEYFARFGQRGTLLYASRSKDAPALTTVAPRLNDPKIKGFVCGYAGSISTPGYARSLSDLAEALRRLDGTLSIYGEVDGADAKRFNLTAPNIKLNGLVPSAQLIERLRQDLDLLFVPMSFEKGERKNMEVSFPSKMTDYTATGLPLLIYGPPYSSIVRWAKEHKGVAEVVDTEDVELLESAVFNGTRPGRRQELANRSIQIGDQLFSHRAAWEIFENALRHTSAANLQ